MSQLVKYVGLNVRKDTIAVAVAKYGKRFEVRERAEIANTPGGIGQIACEACRAGCRASYLL